MEFKPFKLFKRFNPLLILPRDAGEGTGGGLERSIAVERSKAIERFELVQLLVTLDVLTFSR